MESVNKQLVDQGISPVLMTHDEFTKFLNDDIERWSKLAKARDIKP
jgi:tripartite-type tricarboxylate transporter receptor subunit TctC